MKGEAFYKGKFKVAKDRAACMKGAKLDNQIPLIGSTPIHDAPQNRAWQ